LSPGSPAASSRKRSSPRSAYCGGFGGVALVPKAVVFRSSRLDQIITTLDHPTTGVFKNGSLAGSAIAFQNGGKSFSFQVISGGGLNWAATAPGGVLLRGLGASRFTPVGVLTVPEPSTWAIMLLGFAGLGFVGYRQTRRAKLRAA
jgi:hypothetical protein